MHTRSSTFSPSPPKNPGSPQRLHSRENLKFPELPSRIIGDSFTPVPMQLGRARLSPSECLRRLSSNSCLYCGTTGYYIATCPVKKQSVRWWAIQGVSKHSLRSGSSRFWKAFCTLIGASASLSSGFQPQSNGQSERANQDLETTFRCLISANPITWSQQLVWVEYAIIPEYNVLNPL